MVRTEPVLSAASKSDHVACVVKNVLFWITPSGVKLKQTPNCFKLNLPSFYNRYTISIQNALKNEQVI